MARRTANRQRKRVADAAGAGVDHLPALDTLSDVPGIDDLQATDRQRAAFVAAVEAAVANGADAGELALGCVVRLDRGYPAVVCARGLFRAEFAARLTKGLTGPTRAAVGDWVCARLPHGHDMGLIEEILPRESDIARWRGGARGERQTLAANVDMVLVVQQVGERPISPRRIARSAVVARDCGAEVAVILTKADRATDEMLTRDVELVREIVGADCPVALVSAVAESGEDRRICRLAEELGVVAGEAALGEIVPRGRMAIVLGESGAGKSTLLNAVLGREVLKTGAVREADDKGRHTTVARRMVRLPGAGVIVDAPGLRRLQVLGHERGLALVFPEIAEAAETCRFRDCTHTHEPGCGVIAAHEAGEISDVRLGCYLALAAEMREGQTALDPDVVL